MQISEFSISSDRSSLEISLTDAAAVTSLRVWNATDYRDFSKSVDLTNKLDSTSTQVITVSLAEMTLSYFDGVYILEADDSSSVQAAITSDLTKFKECILNKVMSNTICDDCLDEESKALVNAQALLYALETSVEEGFIDEIKSIIGALDKYCTDECKTCGEYTNQVNINYYSSNE